MTISEQTTVNKSKNRLSSRVNPLELSSHGAVLLDQTKLPNEVTYVTITDAREMAEAITTMIVRGAPAIGVAGAFGVVLSARHFINQGLSLDAFKESIKNDALILRESRPTAVNLMWAIDQMIESLKNGDEQKNILDTLTQLALKIQADDIESCKSIGDHGAAIVPEGAGILTHCNAGALATAGYGTALGVVRSAFANDPTISVYADETRPRLQGAKLTTWELKEDGIPVTLITDGMSGHLMKQGKVHVVVTGADRIAANGDSANKIGTYNLALVAKAHNVPFYIAAPLSTFDMSLEHGDLIPIEERDAEEIHTVGNEQLCAEGINFYNPGFDVTPAEIITGIITEKGIAKPPYKESIQQLFNHT